MFEGTWRHEVSGRFSGRAFKPSDDAPGGLYGRCNVSEARFSVDGMHTTEAVRQNGKLRGVPRASSCSQPSRIRSGNSIGRTRKIARKSVQPRTGKGRAGLGGPAGSRRRRFYSDLSCEPDHTISPSTEGSLLKVKSPSAWFETRHQGRRPAAASIHYRFRTLAIHSRLRPFDHYDGLNLSRTPAGRSPGQGKLAKAARRRQGINVVQGRR